MAFKWLTDLVARNIGVAAGQAPSISLDPITGAVDFPRGDKSGLKVPASVTQAGGAASFWGPPNSITSGINSADFSTAINRVYFSPFYVDRASTLEGSFVIIRAASTTAGSLLRGGIYHLGQANGANWTPGELVVDFGAVSAEVVAQHQFNITPILLQPGWYTSTLGTDGAGLTCRGSLWATPGQFEVYPDGTRLRLCGPSAMLRDPAGGAEIVGGFPANWPRDVTVMETTSAGTQIALIPKWKRW